MLVMGVDAGGTSTRAVLATDRGECVGFGRGASGNPTSSGIPVALAEVRRAIAGALDEAGAAAVVGGAVGESGRNEDYLLNTISHLEALGIRDRWLENVARRIAAT